MLPYACLEFEGSHQQGKKRLPVNPARVIKGLQPHELLPVIMNVITYMLMHPMEFCFTMQISGSGNITDLVYCEAQKIINSRPAGIYFTPGELRVIRATRDGLRGKQLCELLHIKSITLKKYRRKIYDKLCEQYKKPNRVSTIVWYAKMAGIE